MGRDSSRRAALFDSQRLAGRIFVADRICAKGAGWDRAGAAAPRAGADIRVRKQGLMEMEMMMMMMMMTIVGLSSRAR